MPTVRTTIIRDRSNPPGGFSARLGLSHCDFLRVYCFMIVKLKVRGCQARWDRSSSSGGGCGALPPRANTGFATTETGACVTIMQCYQIYRVFTHENPKRRRHVGVRSNYKRIKWKFHFKITLLRTKATNGVEVGLHAFITLLSDYSFVKSKNLHLRQFFILIKR